MKCEYCLQEAEYQCAVCDAPICLSHTEIERQDGDETPVCHEGALSQRNAINAHGGPKGRSGGEKVPASGANPAAGGDDQPLAREQLDAGFKQMTREQFIDPMEYEPEESGGA